MIAVATVASRGCAFLTSSIIVTVMIVSIVVIVASTVSNVVVEVGTGVVVAVVVVVVLIVTEIPVWSSSSRPTILPSTVVMIHALRYPKSSTRVPVMRRIPKRSMTRGRA
ncbi:hypothetical protein RIF29_34127 [Crotalaria pallida]|uniref:Uncharacterized protein n=1 Tax=Crotalaria pallida TaxID=3830 RepID=A0AAN9E941_CROPI